MVRQGFNDDILEKKYKILRTSIMLGNIKDREEVLNSYAKATREVDLLRSNDYEEVLASKMYTTTTLVDEAERLTSLINLIEDRINERKEFVNDYIKITNNLLDDLPVIPGEDELDDYKLRLANINEYLSNKEEIDNLNNKLVELRDALAEKYENKASSELINSRLEDELIDEFNKIVIRDEYYNSLNYMDIDSELVKIDSNLNDKFEVMNTFVSSYEALKNAGISGAEREEYLSYVMDSKNDYYHELEKKYVLNIYKLVLDKQNNYDNLYHKRENIDELLTKRINDRRKLDITMRDDLDYFSRLCNEQFSIIKSQKINMENIEKLITQISNTESRLEELDKANSRYEIVSLLDEFSVERPEIEKIDLPVEEEIHEEVIKKNKEENEDRPANLVIKVSEPVKMNVRNASDTAKLVMKKVVIVLEPKKFNGTRDKLAEAEKELEERKKQEEMLKETYQAENTDDIFVTMDIDNKTDDGSDDVFVTTDGNTEVKIDIPDSKDIPTEIFIDEPEPMKPADLFSETDPFLDDNEFEKQEGNKEEKLSEMPEVKNIGTVKPNNVLSQIEEMSKENNDIILPTMGLTNNEKVEVPIVSENYIQ